MTTNEIGNDPANAAPGTLELVRRFVDSEDLYNGRDGLATGGSAAAWLAREGLPAPGTTVTEADLSTLRALRGALREMAAAHTVGAPAPAGAVETFNGLVAPHTVAVHLDVAGGAVDASLRPGTGGAVSVLAAAVHRAVLTGTWTRLKACSNPDCRWLFYDESRSRTARWCSMRGCGSITKSRRYRQRRRSDG